MRMRNRTRRLNVELLEDRCLLEHLRGFRPFGSGLRTFPERPVHGRRLEPAHRPAGRSPAPGPRRRGRRTTTTSASSTPWMVSTYSRGCRSHSAAPST